MKNVTVYDIAKEANVSVTTVSRVLNGTAPVKESTRLRIVELINKYQFQPNALARSLVKKVTGTLGIIIPDITNPFFPEVISGIEEEASNKGYTFFLCNTGGDYERETRYLSVLREKQVDGIIFIGGRINLAECEQRLIDEVVDVNKWIPIVLVNGDLPHTSFHRVITDEFVGAEMATQHLIKLGHVNIAFIGGYNHMTTTIQKVMAFKETMGNNGLKARKEWILHGNFSMEAGESLMTAILEKKQRPSAVFCVNDFTAVGAIKAAYKAGMRIPNDISIIGFDNTPLASSIIPELTTISQNSMDLGRAALKVLHHLINKEQDNKVTILQPKLIIRESTGTYRGSDLEVFK